MSHTFAPRSGLPSPGPGSMSSWEWSRRVFLSRSATGLLGSVALRWLNQPRAAHAAHWSHATHFVILRTLCCVTDDVVCSRDVLELFFGFFVARVGVRVKLSR